MLKRGLKMVSLIVGLSMALVIGDAALAYNPNGATGDLPVVHDPVVRTGGTTDAGSKDTLSKDESITLELLASETTLMTGQTATLTAKFSGAVKPCTDARCTGTLYRYINDIVSTEDDSGLAVTLQNISQNPFLTTPVYTATYLVTAREEGVHSVSVRVNGSQKGSFIQKQKEFTVLFQGDCSMLPDGNGGYVMDCQDGDNEQNPPAACTPSEEICDGIDNNCDGQTDEGCEAPVDCETIIYHLDLDGDGYGGGSKDVVACAPPSDLYVEDGSDCDDHNEEINPGADEICNDGLDNNCDGQADEGCEPPVACSPTDENCETPPADADGDGYTVDEDCDDSNAMVYPGAPELCDDFDNDCNGVIDDSETCQISPNINVSPTMGPVVPVGPAQPQTSSSPNPSKANQLSGGYLLGGSGCQLDRNLSLPQKAPLTVILGLLVLGLVVARRTLLKNITTSPTGSQDRSRAHVWR